MHRPTNPMLRFELRHHPSETSHLHVPSGWQRTMQYPPVHFLRLGLTLLNCPAMNDPSTVDTRRFRSTFGTSPEVCAVLWNETYEEMKVYNRLAPKHLMWALHHLKAYDTEETASRWMGRCDEQTWRKWIWRFIEAIGNLEDEVVSTWYTILRSAIARARRHCLLVHFLFLSSHSRARRLFGRIAKSTTSATIA